MTMTFMDKILQESNETLIVISLLVILAFCFMLWMLNAINKLTEVRVYLKQASFESEFWRLKCVKLEHSLELTRKLNSQLTISLSNRMKENVSSQPEDEEEESKED